MQSDDWNRRKFLATVVGTVAGLAVLPKSGFATGGTSIKVAQSAGTEPPRFEAPAGAVDCHHHIYDWRYPFAAWVSGRPAEARVSDYRMLQKRLGTSRNVMVQPTQYSEDNRLLLASLKEFGTKTTRAIVVVPSSIGDSELEAMKRAGVCGIRFDFLRKDNIPTWEFLESMARRIAPLGWHVQINAKGEDFVAHKELLKRLSCPIVFDHLARAHEVGARKDEVLATVSGLMKQGKAWTKIAFDVSKVGPPTYSDMVAIATEYIQQAPDRLVWGTNWPHPGQQVKPDDAAMFDLLAQVAPDEKIRKRILVDNPVKLYEF